MQSLQLLWYKILETLSVLMPAHPCLGQQELLDQQLLEMHYRVTTVSAVIRLFVLSEVQSFDRVCCFVLND
jgi:hypothetical protein